MGIKEMIAASGAANFEKIRKGWLPTIEETQARNLRDLQIEQTKQEVDYAPKKRKMARQTQQAELVNTQMVTEKIKGQIAKQKTDEQWTKFEKNHAITATFIRGAMNSYKEDKNIESARALIRDNLEAVKDAGDDEKDKLIDRFLSEDTTDKQAVTILNNLNAVLPAVQSQLDKEALQRIKKTGSTAWERSLEGLTLPEKKVLEDARRKKLSGIATQERFDTTKVYKTEKDIFAATERQRKESKLDMKRIVDRNNTIKEALQSMDAGNNSLSDKLLTSILTQLNDTDVRAMAMYRVFDSSFGNIFERAVDWVSRLGWGQRTDSQNKIIRDVLETMQKYSEPAMVKIRQQNRALAKESGLDPFKVVKPVSAIDIRDSKLIDKDEKMRLLEAYPEYLNEL